MILLFRCERKGKIDMRLKCNKIGNKKLNPTVQLRAEGSRFAVCRKQEMSCRKDTNKVPVNNKQETDAISRGMQNSDQ
jgi:hypothetical protein